MRKLRLEKEEEEFVVPGASGPLYKQSPLYVRYAPFLERAKKAGTTGCSKPSNPLYSPKLADACLKKHLPYLPLVMRKFTCYGRPDEERPNNAIVERYNRFLKDDTRLNVGQIGCVGLVSYLERAKERAELEQRIVSMGISDSYLTKSRKKEQRLMGAKEHYKTDPKAALFFDSNHLKKIFNNLTSEPTTPADPEATVEDDSSDDDEEPSSSSTEDSSFDDDGGEATNRKQSSDRTVAAQLHASCARSLIRTRSQRLNVQSCN